MMRQAEVIVKEPLRCLAPNVIVLLELAAFRQRYCNCASFA